MLDDNKPTDRECILVLIQVCTGHKIQFTSTCATATILRKKKTTNKSNTQRHFGLNSVEIVVKVGGTTGECRSFFFLSRASLPRRGHFIKM